MTTTATLVPCVVCGLVLRIPSEEVADVTQITCSSTCRQARRRLGDEPKTKNIRVGTRVRLTHDVDRFPHFIAAKGMEGTVTVCEDDLPVCVLMDDEIQGAGDWGNEIHWFDDMNIHDDVEVLNMTTRTYMDVRFDVTDLSDAERAGLAMEVVVQGESSDDHPTVEVGEIEWNEVEVEARTVLVHLNITVPAGDERSAEAIGELVQAAYEIGSDDDLVRGLDVAVALAEEV